MRTRFLATFVAVVLTIAGGITTNKAAASPADEYTGTHFGLGNIPQGCEGDSFKKDPNDAAPRLDNACYHMRTGMNGLDSPDVDVLIMVPASPTASRDMRIIKQAVQMWQGGIHYLAPQMGVPWMKNMKFHISTDIEGAAAGEGFVSYPVVDPEIVIIASNPVGGVGIGIDPWVNYPGAITGQDMPCTGVSNPFDMDTWKGMPGYDHHGHEDGATVTEDCGGAGGNICFALTPAIDPMPPKGDFFNLFDLVSHEFGHCLTIGHVGDGAEAQTEGGPWSKIATNDIMSYNTNPPGMNKCVSTLDVEGIAVTQSHYIDTNGDHVVDNRDHVDANEKEWDRPAASGGEHFQVQNPRDEAYASSTGSPFDCPQPDLGLLPGTPTNWQPDPVTTSSYALDVTSPHDGDSTEATFDVTGTVTHTVSGRPTTTSGRYDDATDDATSPLTEIDYITAEDTASDVNAVMKLESLPPTGTNVDSPTTYSLFINEREFESFVLFGALSPVASTFDTTAGAYLPDGTSTWDTTTNTVTFKIPRSYLSSVGVNAPYTVSTKASYGNVGTLLADDWAPNGGKNLGLASSKSALRLPEVSASPTTTAETVQLEHPGGNHFDTAQSEGDAREVFEIAGVNDNSHYFNFAVPDCSNVALTLDWTDGTGASDLDMYVTGTDVDSGTDAAGGDVPEKFSLTNYKGQLTIQVAPYLIADAIDGVDYTLTAVTTAATGCASTGDTTGPPPPPPAPEYVRVYLDGSPSPWGSAVVDSTSGAPSAFTIPVNLPTGDHTLLVSWERYGFVVATKSINVRSGPSETTTTSTTSTTVAPTGNGHGNDDEHGHNGHGGPNAKVVAVPVHT